MCSARACLLRALEAGRRVEELLADDAHAEADAARFQERERLEERVGILVVLPPRGPEDSDRPRRPGPAFARLRDAGRPHARLRPYPLDDVPRLVVGHFLEEGGDRVEEFVAVEGRVEPHLRCGQRRRHVREAILVVALVLELVRIRELVLVEVCNGGQAAGRFRREPEELVEVEHVGAEDGVPRLARVDAPGDVVGERYGRVPHAPLSLGRRQAEHGPLMAAVHNS